MACKAGARALAIARHYFFFVLPGLVPGIHAFEAVHRLKAWMAAEFGLARIRQGF
jgi:hypothetical protein